MNTEKNMTNCVASNTKISPVSGSVVPVGEFHQVSVLLLKERVQ